MSKRKLEEGSGEESDLLTIRPLYAFIQDFLRISVCLIDRGAGQEVGRSCIMLEFKNKKIMVRTRGSEGSTITVFVRALEKAGQSV